MTDTNVLVVRVLGTAEYPRRAYATDAGADIWVTQGVWLWPYVATDLPSGWKVKIPEGHFGLILSRSSTFKKRHIMVHSGVIDSSFTGELSVLVRNLLPWPVYIKRYTRLAQLLVLPCVSSQFVQVNELPFTDRGESGFGSTGGL